MTGKYVWVEDEKELEAELEKVADARRRLLDQIEENVISNMRTVAVILVETHFELIPPMVEIASHTCCGEEAQFELRTGGKDSKWMLVLHCRLYDMERLVEKFLCEVEE
jgi:hypothetical protein